MSNLQTCPSRRITTVSLMQKLRPLVQMAATFATIEILKVIFKHATTTKAFEQPTNVPLSQNHCRNFDAKIYANSREWSILLPRWRFSRYFEACDDHKA